MATITKRGDYQYQAKVRRQGFPTQTKTFERKRDAQDWAAIVEAEMSKKVNCYFDMLRNTLVMQWLVLR